MPSTNNNKDSEVEISTINELANIGVEFKFYNDAKVIGEANANASRHFAPGEPVIVEVKLENASTDELELDLGTDGDEAFRIDILDKDNEVVCASTHIRKEGLSRSGRVRLPEGTSQTRIIILNKWCSTILAQGDYRATLHLRSEPFEGDAQFPLLIGASDEERLRALFDKLLDEATKSVDVQARDVAAQAITSTRSPLAVEPLSKLLRAAQDSDSQSRIVDALMRIGTIEAVDFLSSIVKQKEPDLLVAKATSALFEIEAHTNDVAVREACGEILKTLKKPQQPRIRD